MPRTRKSQNKNLSITVSTSLFFVSILCVSIHRVFQEESVTFENTLLRVNYTYIEITKNMYI
jgi:hypothetical protein